MIPARKTHLRAAVAAILSALLALEPALLSAGEGSFWSDRRKAMSAPAKADDAVPTASNTVLASLPTIANPVAMGTGIKSAAGLARLDLAGKVPDWVQTAVTPFATIQSARLSAGDKQPTVIIVQDAHLHNEAQHQIGSVVEALGRETSAKGGPLLVGLEGAPAGDIDLSAFRSDNPAVMKDVAWAMEEAHLLTGVEAAAVSNAGTPAAPGRVMKLVGTEDPALYDANVKALRDSVPFEKSAAAALEDLRRELTELKRKHFDAELTRFDARKDAYEEGTLSLPDYALYLDSVVTATDPNLRDLIEAALIEGSLKFDRVERERKDLLSALIPKMSEAEVKDLLQASLLFRAGQVSYAAYYENIKALAARHALPLSKFPEMNIYIQYVLKSEAIDHKRLFEAIGALESTVETKLASTDEQRDVLSLVQDYHLLKKLTQRALIESEWHRLEARRDGVGKILDRLAALGGGRPQSLVDMAPKWDTFEAFYVAALQRNQAMTNNFASAVQKSGERNAVMVAGGFHSEGLAALLEKRGLNVFVLSPKITKVNDGPSSLDFLAAGRLPLDELFVGEKLFLTTPPMTATEGPLAADTAQVAATVALTGGPAERTEGERVVSGREVPDGASAKGVPLSVRGRTIVISVSRAARGVLTGTRFLGSALVAPVANGYRALSPVLRTALWTLLAFGVTSGMLALAGVSSAFVAPVGAAVGAVVFIGLGVNGFSKLLARRYPPVLAGGIAALSALVVVGGLLALFGAPAAAVISAAGLAAFVLSLWTADRSDPTAFKRDFVDRLESFPAAFGVMGVLALTTAALFLIVSTGPMMSMIGAVVGVASAVLFILAAAGASLRGKQVQREAESQLTEGHDFNALFVELRRYALAYRAAAGKTDASDRRRRLAAAAANTLYDDEQPEVFLLALALSYSKYPGFAATTSRSIRAEDSDLVGMASRIINDRALTTDGLRALLEGSNLRAREKDLMAAVWLLSRHDQPEALAAARGGDVSIGKLANAQTLDIQTIGELYTRLTLNQITVIGNAVRQAQRVLGGMRKYFEQVNADDGDLTPAVRAIEAARAALAVNPADAALQRELTSLLAAFRTKFVDDRGRDVARLLSQARTGPGMDGDLRLVISQMVASTERQMLILARVLEPTATGGRQNQLARQLTGRFFTRAVDGKTTFDWMTSGLRPDVPSNVLAPITPMEFDVNLYRRDEAASPERWGNTVARPATPPAADRTIAEEAPAARAAGEETTDLELRASDPVDDAETSAVRPVIPATAEDWGQVVTQEADKTTVAAAEGTVAARTDADVTAPVLSTPAPAPVVGPAETAALSRLAELGFPRGSIPANRAVDVAANAERFDGLLEAAQAFLGAHALSADANPLPDNFRIAMGSVYAAIANGRRPSAAALALLESGANGARSDAGLTAQITALVAEIQVLAAARPRPATPAAAPVAVAVPVAAPVARPAAIPVATAVEPVRYAQADPLWTSARVPAVPAKPFVSKPGKRPSDPVLEEIQSVLGFMPDAMRPLDDARARRILDRLNALSPLVRGGSVMTDLAMAVSLMPLLNAARRGGNLAVERAAADAILRAGGKGARLFAPEVDEILDTVPTYIATEDAAQNANRRVTRVVDVGLAINGQVFVPANVQTEEAPPTGLFTRVSPKHPERNNDAAFRLALPGGGSVAGVFDGIGNNKGSDVAARAAARVFRDRLSGLTGRESDAEIKRALREAMVEAAGVVTGPGTTATVVVMVPRANGRMRTIVLNQGDSRAWVVNGRQSRALTVDNHPGSSKGETELSARDVARQRKTNLLDRLGEIASPSDAGVTAAEKKAFEDRRFVRNALVPGIKPNAVFTVDDLRPGDRFVLTTDGVHDNLTDSEVLQTVNGVANASSGAAAQALVDAAFARSRGESGKTGRAKPDDITAIVLDVPTAIVRTAGTRGLGQSIEEVRALIGDRDASFAQAAFYDNARAFPLIIATTLAMLPVAVLSARLAAMVAQLESRAAEFGARFDDMMKPLRDLAQQAANAADRGGLSVSRKQILTAVLPMLGLTDTATDAVLEQAAGMRKMPDAEARDAMAEFAASFPQLKKVKIDIFLYDETGSDRFSFVRRSGDRVVIRISNETLTAVARRVQKELGLDAAAARKLALQHLLLKEVTESVLKISGALLRNRVLFADDALPIGLLPAATLPQLIAQIKAVQKSRSKAPVLWNARSSKNPMAEWPDTFAGATLPAAYQQDVDRALAQARRDHDEMAMQGGVEQQLAWWMKKYGADREWAFFLVRDQATGNLRVVMDLFRKGSGVGGGSGLAGAAGVVDLRGLDLARRLLRDGETIYRGGHSHPLYDEAKYGTVFSAGDFHSSNGQLVYQVGTERSRLMELWSVPENAGWTNDGSWKEDTTYYKRGAYAADGLRYKHFSREFDASRANPEFWRGFSDLGSARETSFQVESRRGTAGNGNVNSGSELAPSPNRQRLTDLLASLTVQPVLRQMFDAIRARQSVFVGQSRVQISFDDAGNLTNESFEALANDADAFSAFNAFVTSPQAARPAAIGALDSDGVQNLLNLGDPAAVEAYDSATAVEEYIRNAEAFLAGRGKKNAAARVDLVFSTPDELKSQIAAYIAFARDRKIQFGEGASAVSAADRAQAVLNELNLGAGSRLLVVGFDTKAESDAFAASLSVSPDRLNAMRTRAAALLTTRLGTSVSLGRTVVFSARQLAIERLESVMQVMVLTLYQPVGEQLKAAALVAIQA